MSVDVSALTAVLHSAAESVSEQLTQALGVQLQLGEPDALQGSWAELARQLPASATVSDVALQGAYSGRLGLVWAATDEGTPAPWLETATVQDGLQQAISAGVSQGLSSVAGATVRVISPDRSPLSRDTPVGLEAGAKGHLVTWQAVGGGVTLFLGIVVGESMVDKLLIAPGCGTAEGVGVGAADASSVHARPPHLASFEALEATGPAQDLEMIMDLPLRLTVEIGSARRLIRDVLSLGRGSVIELDRVAGEPVDVLVNSKLLARGEIVVLPGGNFGVRVTDILNSSDRLRGLPTGR